MSYAVYKNGNALTRISLVDGTKERITKDEEFDLEFPESIDLNIGNKCDGGCKFCYINASQNGIDAELLNHKFIDTLHPYTEVAINGNSLMHPQLVPFLEKLHDQKLIANITVNQIHFERKEDLLRELVDKDLVKGIGISLRNPTPEFIERVSKYSNAVIHTINGILSASDIEAMRDHNLKLLILGYKNLGRGTAYKLDNDVQIEARQRYLFDVLPTLQNHFAVVSLDNLAIEQLNPKRFISQEKWDQIYMGDEGSSSMYIDLVERKFGVSSLALDNEMYPIMDDIRDMFAVVKNISKRN